MSATDAADVSGAPAGDAGPREGEEDSSPAAYDPGPYRAYAARCDLIRRMADAAALAAEWTFPKRRPRGTGPDVDRWAGCLDLTAVYQTIDRWRWEETERGWAAFERGDPLPPVSPAPSWTARLAPAGKRTRMVRA